MNEASEVTKQQEKQTLEQATKEFLAKGGRIQRKPASGKTTRGKKQPPKKAKQPSGKKRPALTSWSMLKVREGTVLTCTLSEHVQLVTRSFVTMEVELVYKGKSKGRFLGTAKAEAAVRTLVKRPLKGKCQGWNVFLVPDSPKKGERESVYKRYDRMVSLA